MKRSDQLAFDWKSWGGARKGAGRKPKGPRAMVEHSVRPDFKARFPVHVTVRLVEGLPSLRTGKLLVALHDCFARAEKDLFRVCHFSIQENHVHLIVEAEGKAALSSGMQGLCTSIARRMNRELGRRGRFFADRYHARVLRTPTEVRNALRYVLHNTKHHGRHYEGVDWFSSGLWFTGWIDHEPIENPPPIARARTWLLGIGWKRAGGRLRTNCQPA
jgi:REP element-mobilizing transposase RayT